MALVKYVMLLPLAYNDGSRVSQEVHNEIFDRIFEFAGGWTMPAQPRGPTGCEPEKNRSIIHYKCGSISTKQHKLS